MPQKLHSNAPSYLKSFLSAANLTRHEYIFSRVKSTSCALIRSDWFSASMRRQMSLDPLSPRAERDKREVACSAGGFWRCRVDIPIGRSGRHLEFGKQWRGEKFTASGREKEKLGRGEGEGKEKSFPALHLFGHSRIAFSPQFSPSATNLRWRLITRKVKPHQNRLHCRLKERGPELD